MTSGEKYRSNLIRKTSGLSLVTAWFGSIIMYIFTNQAYQMTIIAGAICVLVFSAFLFIHCYPQKPYNGIILLIVCMLSVFLPTLFSGGVNSRFIVLITILPMIMCLILNKSQTYILMTLLLVFVASLNFVTPHLPNYTNSYTSALALFPKTLWLFMASVLSFVFALVFIDINSKLTIQLENSSTDNNQTGLYNKPTILAHAEKLLLKLKNNPNSRHYLSIMVIEPYAIIDGLPTRSEKIQMPMVAKLLNKYISRDADFVGELDSRQLLVCLQTKDKHFANKVAEKLLKVIEPSKVSFPEIAEEVSVNIGILSVDSSIQVDINSLLSLAQLTLRRAKESNVLNVLDYDDLKKNK